MPMPRPILTALLSGSLLIAAVLAAPASARQDPLRLFERALTSAEVGQRSLARRMLDPVVISPRIDASLRARAYYARGLFHYLDGHWVSASQDYRRALEFDPELGAALGALAWLHLHGLGVPRHPARALSLYHQAAAQGDAQAQFNLGLLLTQGRIVEPDPERALQAFEAAASQGHVEAMVQAGQLLRSGPGGKRTDAFEAAHEHFRRAADSGHLRAKLELGLLLSSSQHPQRDAAAAAGWLEAAAAHGSAAAQTRLGYMHLHGDGVERDPALARQWFGEAARQGDRSAQVHLGWLHDRGIGGSADPERAYRWYRRAAERDDPTAQLNLALLYRFGRGVDADVHRARHWFERAAETGSESARGELAWLLATAEDPKVRDPDRAIELAREAVASSPSASWLDTLAAALATSGRFEDAIAVQQQALAILAEESPAEALLEGPRRSAYLGRLAHYRAGRPWLEAIDGSR